jgi:hypothetical protein
MATLKQLISGARLNSLGPVEVINIGRPGDPTQLLLYKGKIFVYNAQGQALIDGGIISALNFQVSSVSAEKLSSGIKKFLHNIVFTATDYNTVTWGSGTLFKADGTTVTINAGTTGNIAGKVYIYFNNTATLQVTTVYSSAIGGNNIPLAIIDPSVDTDGKATISSFSSPSTTIDGGVITTGKIQSTDTRTYFDLDNDQLVIFDGVTRRVVIGKISTGVYGIKVSLPGYDAITDTDPIHFALWATSSDTENHVLIKESTRGTVSIADDDNEPITHGFTYIPMCFVFIEESSGVFKKLSGSFGDASSESYYEISDTNLTIFNKSGSTKNFKYYIFYDQVG